MSLNKSYNNILFIKKVLKMFFLIQKIFKKILGIIILLIVLCYAYSVYDEGILLRQSTRQLNQLCLILDKEIKIVPTKNQTVELHNLDIWGMPVKKSIYKIDRGWRIKIFSAGPDKLYLTEDDLSIYADISVNRQISSICRY